jgi:hypothetical protein
MNDKNKTKTIPVSEVNRVYVEAVEANQIEPTIIDEGKVVKPADPFYWNPGMQSKMFIMPPMRTDPGKEPLSIIDFVMNRTKETTQAFNMLKEAGFLESQVDDIRKAVCKKTKAAATYWWQYKTLFAAKFPDAMPIRAEENWQTICNLFDKPNPLEPKEYFYFYESENNRTLSMRATERFKKLMQMNSEIAHDLNIPAAVKVETVKPDQPVMRKMYGVSEGIEPTFQKFYKRSVCICDLNALMMHGCKCDRPVMKAEVKTCECTCPTSVLMVSGCKCGSMKK